VRAASPWPGAFTAIGDVDLTLTEVRATSAHPAIVAALQPGEATVRDDGVAMVRARDVGVELVRGRALEDDDERELDAAGLAALIRAPLQGNTPGK
jgi:methionyl-tRNA formyltransferase